MSFDLFLQGFQLGETCVSDREAVLKILREHCEDRPDDFGFYSVNFSDGSHVEFSASGLEGDKDFDVCAFHIHGFSPHVISFVWDVACAGDMVIFNAQGTDNFSNPVVIYSDSSQQQHLPDGITKFPVLCNSAEHLWELLGVGYEDWRNYRDQVVGTLKRPGFSGGSYL